MKRLSVLVLTLSWGFGGFVKLPYLQSLTDSSVVLCWEQSDSAPARIEFGLSLPPGQVVLDSSRSRCREVLISGLVSDTCYYYRVIVNGDTSPTCRFRTPSVSMGHFRLVAYGDNRTDSAAHQQVVNRLLQTVPPPMLLINVGDLTENGTEEEFQTFFNISRELLGGFPLFPAIGNHEMRNIGTFLNRFVLPGNEHYYTVRWGNAVFHVLDNYSDFSPGSEQYNWLVNQLLQDSATPSLRHIFIVFHEPPWTTSLGHSSNLEVREFLCPLFSRFHVDMVFCGHIHAYEHSLVDGVHYITTGGGGAPLHTEWAEPEPWTVYREAVHQFTLIDIAGDTVFSRGVRTDGSEFDSLTIVRRTPALKEAGSPVSGRFGLRYLSGAIELTLGTADVLTLAVYDGLGRKLRAFGPHHFAEGRNRLPWQPERSGTYFIVCRASTRKQVARLVFVQ